MSDVSILSAQFGALSKMVDEVNQSIIVLKTQAVQGEARNEGFPRLDEEELQEAAAYMRSFLKRLELLEHPDEHSEQLLPNQAVTQLQQTIISSRQNFFDELRAITLAVENGAVLAPPQLKLLDAIVEALDQERSELFKKLRAARG